MSERFPIRTINVRGRTYIRLEDVQTMIRELGATEATDVRNRTEALAESLDALTRPLLSTRKE